MKEIHVADVRTVSLMGHTGSGKTTITDALAFKLGLNDRLGSVVNGSSVADYSDEEKTRKITIFAKPFHGEYTTAGGRKLGVTVVDTPGFMDFYGQVIAAARATDAALITIDASAGVQVGTRRVWKCLDSRNVKARGFIITGLDKENTDYNKTLSAIQEAFGQNCVPVVLPDSAGGVIDILAAKDIPADMAETANEYKGALVERAAETDDTLIEKFLEGEELSPDEIAKGLVASVANGGLYPVFVCKALKDVGITELLEGIGRLFPSPLDVDHHDTEGKLIDAGEDAAPSAFVWRTMNDAFVGQLTFVRVLGGTLKPDSELLNVNKDQKEKVGSLLVVNGKKQETVETAVAGDIVAIPKLKSTEVGDTLCGGGAKVTYPPIKFPPPVMFQAVYAKTQADEDKLGTALQRVCQEDPTLHVVRNTETRESILQGLGDVHIDVAVKLMKKNTNVDVVLSTPKVPYRETVTALGEGHHKHKKQSGGRGQYGEVYLRVEPRQPDEEEWFVDAIVGGAIPGNFLPAVQKGLVEGMQAGSVAGYPVTNVKITVYDGSYHDVDSSEVAFKIAGSRALRDGMSKAKPVLLEPIMKAKIMVPDQFMGDVSGDLNQKRGRILGMGSEDGMQVITADVPQSELFRYAAELRSITGGQGTFEMEFSRYDIVPANVAQKVIAEAQREKEDE